MNNSRNILKEKLAEIKNKPIGILSITYPLILIIGVGIGLFYISNLNEITRQSVPPAIQDTTAQGDLKVVEARNIPPLDIMQASKPTDELVSKGEQIYNTVCQSCHGENGEGNGPAAGALNPPPRNFNSNEGWKNSPKISGIYKTLEEGIPGSAMISYDYLTPEERIGLAHYIRTTYVPAPPQDTDDELKNLELTYNLSQGKEISAQIPVENAMKIIINENKQKVDELVSILNKIRTDTSSEGASIFNRISVNKIQALNALKSSSGWKEDPARFSSVLFNNVNEYVFNSNVRNLSGEDWNELYNYMSRYF